MNTTEMYGALQGIAGSSGIVHIDALELPEEVEGVSELSLSPDPICLVMWIFVLMTMQAELDKERRSLMASWKRRASKT